MFFRTNLRNGINVREIKVDLTNKFQDDISIFGFLALYMYVPLAKKVGKVIVF